MGRQLLLGVVLWVFLLGGRAKAYDLVTHRNLTTHAVNESDLSAYLPGQLEITADHRFDVSEVFDCEGTDAVALNDRQARGWLREGAVREDDNGLLQRAAFRFRNHFYNPLNGQGYSFGLITGIPAPDWGLEDRTVYPGEQWYSWAHGRNYFYEGLTASSPATREQDLALTFCTVGHVVHLIEDMAQPQHTRNDSHGTYAPYEKYTEQIADSLPFDGYPIVYAAQDRITFNAPRRFWHTEEPWVRNRKGLADYSNRGFVTEETNFSTIPYGGSPDVLSSAEGFPDPAGADATLWQPSIEALDASQPCRWRDAAYQPHGVAAFVQTTVHDAYTNADEVNIMTSAESVFDPDLDLWQQPKTFTLNCYNFEAAQALLIPRAVGYSAGLINYFFRGKIDFACDYADAQKPCVVKNLGPDPLYGVFELWAEDPSGARSFVRRWGTNSCNSNGCTVGNGISVNAGDATRVEAFSPAANAARYVLVFRGKMGLEEDAVAGKVFSNSFLLMTLSATYAYHGTGAGVGDVWQQLASGPLDLVDDAWDPALTWWQSELFFAEGAVIGDGLLFASFGSVNGGRLDPLWKSTDGGRSFTEISQSLGGYWSLGPVTWVGGTELLAGAYRNDPDGYPAPGLGNGVAYSNDSGTTWELRLSGPSTDHWVWGVTGFMPGVLYVGNGVVLASNFATGDSSRMIRSTDKGLTWSEVKPFIDGAQWTCPDFLYAGDPIPPSCTAQYDALEAFQNSNCQGSNCQDEEDELYFAFQHCYFEAIAADQVPTPACFGAWAPDAMAWNQVAGAGSVILVAAFGERSNSFGGRVPQSGIWKSTDGGQHWRVVKKMDWTGVDTVVASPLAVAISPSGEALAIFESTGIYDPDIRPGGRELHPKTLYRSTDAGETWQEIHDPEYRDGDINSQRSIGVMYLGSSIPARP
jgi:hypothetical protein